MVHYGKANETFRDAFIFLIPIILYFRRANALQREFLLVEAKLLPELCRLVPGLLLQLREALYDFVPEHCGKHTESVAVTLAVLGRVEFTLQVLFSPIVERHARAPAKTWLLNGYSRTIPVVFFSRSFVFPPIVSPLRLQF